MFELLFSQKSENWNFEIYSFFDLARENTLQFISYYLFNKHGLLNKFHIDQKVFLKFFNKIEAGYLSYNNLYHNHLHAAEVLQSCHYIVSQMGIINYFSDIDVFAAFLNCAIHDFQNDGFSQIYHQMARTDLALLYNDRSVHCNNSVSRAFSIALRDPGCNIFSGISLDVYRKMRQHIIELSYSFDLTLIHERHNGLKKLLKKNETLKHLTILQQICHSCDIGHCAKSWSIHSRNVGSSLGEFCLEGDRAMAQGFKIALMTSRKKSDIIQSHVFFYDHIVDESFLILGNCITKIDEENSEYSYETAREEDVDSQLDCDSGTDLSSRLKSKKYTGKSFTRDSYNMFDVKRPSFPKEIFPWTFHIAENKQRWTRGGLFEADSEKV